MRLSGRSLGCASLEWVYDTAIRTYRGHCEQYSDNSSNDKVSLFIRKLPAEPAKSSEYMGPILINPGGPGGSGNEDVLGFGEDLHALLDGAISIMKIRWGS